MNEMSFWDRIILKKIRFNRSVQRHFFVPYSQVRTVAFVIDYDSWHERMDVIDEIIKHMKHEGKKVYLLFFTRKKVQDVDNYLVRVSRFLSWVKIDTQAAADVFDREYDLAIGFDISRNLLLEYVLSLLKAKQVALPYFGDDTQADVLIKNTTDSLDVFVNQVVTFLNKIKIY